MMRLVGIILILVTGVTHPTKDQVIEVFGHMKNEDGFSFSIQDIDVIPGSFTAKGEQEAIVLFFDENQCHAAGWAEVWLLGYRKYKAGKGWIPISKIIEGDWVSAKAVDIDHDGVKEVFVQTGGGNQGYFEDGYLLISLKGGKSRTLLELTGLNYLGGIFPQETLLVQHNVHFADVSGDSVLEAIDTLVIITGVLKGEGIDVELVRTDTTRYLKVFKFSEREHRFVEISERKLRSSVKR